MKDAKREAISLAKHGNKYTVDYAQSKENTLRQMHNNRIRQGLYQEGYELGVRGGNIDDVTGTVEIDGKIIEKRTDSSFKEGYNLGLQHLREKIKGEESHKAR